GPAVFAAPHTIGVRSEGREQRVTSGHNVIAVGTEPAPPAGVPADGKIVLTTDDILHLDRVPRTLAVVGGGVIGIEYASMFATLGVQVTVADQRERRLEFLDGETVDELGHQTRDHHAV